MRLYVEFDINNFEAWSGAVDTKNRIIEEGKAEAFNSLVEDIFPDGCTETEMNDFLWFDDEQIFDMLGIVEEEEEEETDFSQYEDFDSFCESFNGCCGCPFQHLHGGKCEEHFEEMKK